MKKRESDFSWRAVEPKVYSKREKRVLLWYSVLSTAAFSAIVYGLFWYAKVNLKKFPGLNIPKTEGRWDAR